MIKLGRVKGNKMVDMQLSNDKLIDRGIRMIMEEIPVSYEIGAKLLRSKTVNSSNVVSSLCTKSSN